MKNNKHTSIAIKTIAVLLCVTIGYFAGTASLSAQIPATVPASTTAPTTDSASIGTQSAAPTPIAVSTATAAAPAEPPVPTEKIIQLALDKAVELGRAGQYDPALTQLAKLRQDYPDSEPVKRDYIAVLGWAGHDEEATHLYETVAADQPDYVLAAVGHSYRVTKSPEKALAAYRLGLQKYPDSVIFAEGEIRTLADMDKLDEAVARADEDLRLHGNRPEIVAAKADVVQAQIKEAHDKAVEMARNKNYTGALALFRGSLLDAEHTTDVGIRRDYLATLAWAGGHDAEVIAIYQSLKDENQPDFVLGAVAKAYRNQRHFQQSLEVYRKGTQQYPSSDIFAMGEIHVLMDMRKIDEASNKIRAYESVHGTNSELAAIKRDIAQMKINIVRQKAALLARQGQYQQALALLDKAAGKHTKNIGILQDKLAITGWMGGHDQEVVDQYLALKNPNQPAYVLEAVGKAYRNLGKTNEALAVYENGLNRYPTNEGFAVGTIRSLTDAGYIERAIAVANDNLRRNGNRLPVLMAAADAANQYDLNDTLRYYQTAIKIAPKNPDVLRGYIRTSDRLGAPQIALQTIAENPGIVSDTERRQIEGDDAAAFVRLGILEDSESKGDNHYAGTDRAINHIDARIAAWQQEGPDAQINITRARYDRIIALHNRSRMKEVVSEYESLMAEGATPPTFALGAVGDAYLDLHQPEKARDIYLQLLAIEPKNNLVRRQLFYAYVDLGDYKDAYHIADQMVSTGTVWNRAKDEDVPMTDAEHRDAELTAGAARLYFGQVKEADRILLPVIAANQDSPAAQEAAGNLANAHTLPREALSHYQTGVQLAGGQNLSNEVGIANTQLALHNFPEATASVNSLMARYPDNLSVLRAKRDLDVYNMAEFDLYAGYYFQPTTSHNVSGGQAFGIDAKIYSQPFRYNWRLFAGEYFSHQKEPNAEGSIGLSRSTAGVEYRNGDVTANLAPTYNSYHGTSRVGVSGDATYGINDHWTVAGSGELFSRETPLRALNQGVTANMVNAHALWKQDEALSVRFGGGVMPFSDSNFRSEEDADLIARLLTRPYWKLDGLVSLGLDQNSKDENRSYYNPKSDLIALIGARAIETLYQRYSTMWQHSLQITPGAYWQSHFGTDPVIRARYEHRVFFDQTFEAGLGLNFSRQDYDGIAENDYSLTFDLVDHF